MIALRVRTSDDSPGQHAKARYEETDHPVIILLQHPHERWCYLTGAQRDELTLTAGEQTAEMGRWIMDLAAGRRTFADRLADQQSVTIPSEDLYYGDLGQAFSPWRSPARDAILQPPMPEIPPSPETLQRVMDREADWEAAD